jgi:cell wall-associated NlpC family hydrolase
LIIAITVRLMFACRSRRWCVVVLAAGLAAMGCQIPSASAAAAPTGRLTVVRQDTFTHTLRITGWAVDPAHPRAAVRVRIYLDGVPVRTVLADEPSARVDRAFGLTGAHGYVLTLTKTPRVRMVTVRSRGARSTGRLATVSARKVTHYYPPAGQRIVDVAKRYVGGRYVEGGATPRGFDCSGYTMYAYAQAHVHKLAHNSEVQRRSMRAISRAHARPGDLVFYLSGGHAYHVAIYAGHGWQYAAATVRDGVRYQRVWSTNVRYGTDWH